MPQLSYNLASPSAVGATRTATGRLTVPAYAVPRGTVPPAAGGNPTTTTVALPTPANNGAVRFLMISSDVYEELEYTVNGGADVYPLDGPMLLVGTGAVTLLDAAPTALAISNASAIVTPTVEIIVGRDA